MDAKEYILIATRMCNTFYGKGCDKCQSGSKPFCVATMSNKIAKHVDEAIELVEQFGKDHPGRTRQSELLKMFPDARIHNEVIDFCPKGFLPEEAGEAYCGKYGNCNECRKDYWLTEVTDND